MRVTYLEVVIMSPVTLKIAQNVMGSMANETLFYREQVVKFLSCL